MAAKETARDAMEAVEVATTPNGLSNSSCGTAFCKGRDYWPRSQRADAMVLAEAGLVVDVAVIVRSSRHNSLVDRHSAQ